MLVASVVLACAPGSATASPLELFGFGGRSPAIAGTGVASTDGYESVYLNPAGLAHVTRKRATGGMLVGDFALQMGDDDTGTDPAIGIIYGAALPLPLGGIAKDRVGLGFGLYVPTATINRVRHPFPGVPTFALLESRSHVIAIQFATGVKLTDTVDVGVGVIALAVLQGRIHVATDAAGRFATTSEQQLMTRFAPVLGARWRLRDGLDLGAVLRWVSRSNYDIEVTSDIADVVPIELPTMRIAGTAQYDPATIAVEAAWRARPGLLISGQLQWQHWSGYPLPTLNATTGTPPQAPPDFHDTVVPRVAIEQAHVLGGAILTARGGLAFAMSPAPEASGTQSLLDNHRVIGSAGVGLDLPRARVPLHVDAWVQVHQLVPRRHTKDASAFEPDDALPFEVLDTAGRVIAGGLSVGIDL